MKQTLLLLLSALFINGVFAQHSHHKDEMSCRHTKAKFYEEYFKNTKNVPQTPLLFDYDVKHYFLDIEVANNSIVVDGEVSFYAEVVAEELDTFAFEFLEVNSVDEVYINGLSHSFIHDSDEGFVPLTTPLMEGDMFTAKIVYHTDPPTGGFFAGISTTYDSWGKNVTWTLSEPFAARDWFPVKQVLEDKIDSVWVFLTTAEDNMAGSNGLLTNVVTLPDNKVRYEWKSNYPIAYYLISFAVSEYQEYNIYAYPDEMQGDSVLIQNFVYDVAGCLENYKDGIDQTAEFIELFSELYTLYPFHEEKYGHCLTGLGGGMEHQTMTTIGGFGFWLVAHELGHMWFGDNVTCETWSDIWINEGFASYSEYLALQFIQGQSAASSMMNGVHQNVMSAPGGSVYVPDNEVTYDNVWRIFDGRLSYDKGAAIIHMIRYLVDDDEVFFETLRTFQEQYTDNTATGLDFMGVLNSTSGMEFAEFFEQWYFGEGYPTYSITFSQDDANIYLEIVQTVSKPSVTPLFTQPMEYKLFFYNGGDTIIKLEQTDNITTHMIPMSSENELGIVQVDPNNWVINKTGTVTTNVSESKNQAAFTFGPNPVKQSLHLFVQDFQGGSYTVEVYNMSGLVIMTETSETKSFDLNIAELSAGSYFLQVSKGESTFTEKFIKLD